MRTAKILIDTDAIQHNLTTARHLAPNAKILAMVKANAYGHGIDHCLLAMQSADAIGVATLSEATQVRELGWHKPIILIEGVFAKEQWQQAIQLGCQCVIHNHSQLEWALNSSRKSPSKSPSRLLEVTNPHFITTPTVWLKYNTGMNRLGFTQEDMLDAAKCLNNVGYQLILTSHFANADDKAHPLNWQQIQRFTEMLHLLKTNVNQDIQASLCNSAGMVNFPEYHYNWVRPGLMLYGSSPVLDITAQELNLQAVMTLQASIIAVQHLSVGEVVGYGSRWTVIRPTRLGIVSMGYGDGYPRVVDETAWVTVHQSEFDTIQNVADQPQYSSSSTFRCPIVGRVSMDMLTIDLTDVPKTVGIDATVTLWGRNFWDNCKERVNVAQTPQTRQTEQIPHIDNIAQSANTISYELMCRLTTRPTRCTVIQKT